MPHALDRSRFLDHIRAAGEVYAPGCAGHSLLFERWLQSEPEASAGTRYSGVQIPTVNRFDFAGLHPQARQRTIFLSAELRESWLAGRVDYLLAMREDGVFAQVGQAPPQTDRSGLVVDGKGVYWLVQVQPIARMEQSRVVAARRLGPQELAGHGSRGDRVSLLGEGLQQKEWGR